jgi:hypothetical protein
MCFRFSVVKNSLLREALVRVLREIEITIGRSRRNSFLVFRLEERLGRES